MTALQGLAFAARTEHATCSCGWSALSATQAGALLLGEAHLRRTGIEGHLVTVGGVR